MLSQCRFICTFIVTITLLIVLGVILFDYQDVEYKALAASLSILTPTPISLKGPKVVQPFKNFLPIVLKGPTPTPPPYSHSWYITNVDFMALYNLGASDGTRDNANCAHGIAILDFGQVGNESAYGYGGYGTYYYLAPSYPFVPDYDIEVLVEAYAQGWYSVTNSCPTLKLVIGTNNDHQCPWGNQRGVCNPTDAGTQWGNLVNTVQSWLNQQGYGSPRVIVWAGSDMEQPSGGENWDCATQTRAFVDGFNNNNPAGAAFMNYGTAWLPNNSCWTADDVYWVSWGAAANWPLPEIYTTYATDSWLAIRRQYSMYFKGVMTECQQADPISGNTCVTPSGQFTPNAAWNDLWNQLIVNQVSQDSLDYATNIKQQ